MKQILKLQERLLVLQEENIQLSLQFKQVLHQKEKPRKEQSDLITPTSVEPDCSHGNLPSQHAEETWRAQLPRHFIAGDKAKQMSEPQSAYIQPSTTWTQQLLSQGSQSVGNSKAAQVVLTGLLSLLLTMGPYSKPTVLVSSSEHICISCNVVPISATATALCHAWPLSAQPDREGSSSLVMPCACKSRWNMLTTRLAALIHPSKPHVLQALLPALGLLDPHPYPSSL